MNRFFIPLYLFCCMTGRLIAEEAPSPAPNEGQDRFFYELLNMAVTLTFIVVVLLIISWLVRKMLGKRMEQLNTRSGIKIIERRPLTQKSTIYVLDVHGKGFVVAEAANGIVHLGDVELTAADEEEIDVDAELPK
jgi:flagellar biogenesis protein FliO